MNGISQKNLIYILNWLLVLAVIISAVGFILDFHGTRTYGGIDLRNRVVGARCLIKRVDPYHFKWSQGESELLLDPCDNPNEPVSRVAVPPTVLMIHSVIANLPYKIQRQIWFIFQWVLLLLSIAVFSRNARSEVKSKLIWIVGLLFISGSHFWRLHVERGQIYILYAFLISLAYWVSQKEFKANSFISGIIVGLTASLRPPVIFMAVPMLIYKKWKLFIGNTIGLLSAISISIMAGGISVWKSYVSAMQLMGKIHSGTVKFAPHTYIRDQVIEGMNNLAEHAALPFYDSSLQNIFRRSINMVFSPNVLAISLILCLLFISFVLYKTRPKRIPTGVVFLVASMFLLISEFFIPAWCYSYNNVMWLVPLSLIITISSPLDSLLKPSIILLLVGIFFSITFIEFMYPFNLISDAAITFYIVITTFSILKKYRQEQAETMRI